MFGVEGSFQLCHLPCQYSCLFRSDALGLREGVATVL
jgi:hypothetical protein